MNLPPVWTAEQEAELAQLASEGLSSGQMAKATGRTRNAIIGKCRRKRIKLKGLPCNHPARRNPLRKSRAKPRVNGATTLRAAFDLAATEATDLPYEPITAGEHITGVTPAILALTSLSCKWPIGDPYSPDFHFCMGTKLAEFPYCRKHCRLAYQLPVDRQRRAA